MRNYGLLFMLFFLFLRVTAQEAEKVSIAVLPFINGIGYNSQSNYSGIVQEIVSNQLVKGNRFNIVDRSKFQKVLDELKVQKSEDYLNSEVVEQGRLLGAAYLVTGVVNQHRVYSETSSVYNATLRTYVNVTKWISNIQFTFQVIDVAKGVTLYQDNIAATNTGTHDNEQRDALDNSQCILKKKIKLSVAKIFPEEILLVNVEKADKKGLPETVLISAGANYFDEDYKKGDECEKGIMDKINIFKKKESVRLKVYEIEEVTVGEKVMKREKELGILKLNKVEGEFSICDVAEGAKVIQERLNDRKKIFVKII